MTSRLPFAQRLQLFPILRIALPLALGIWVADAIPHLITVRVWMATTVAVAAAGCALWRKPFLQGATLMAAFFLLGGWLMTVRRQADEVVLPQSAVCYKAVVLSRPVQHGKVVMCDLLLCEGRYARRKVKASFFRDTVQHRYEWLEVGRVVEAASRFEEPQRARWSTSNFDYERWMAVHGFIGKTFVYYRNWRPAHSSLSQLSRLERMQVRLLRFREQLRKRLDAVEADDQAVAVVAAMTLGDKSTLSKASKDVYNMTGVAHVLALSGLHLGIIYFLMTFLFSLGRWKTFGQAMAFVFIWAYAIMVGLMPSVVRAACMYSLYAFVSILGRDRVSLNTLSFAALVMLMENPLTLWDVGFQLSFMSVLGIVLFYRSLFQVVHLGWLNCHRVLKWLWSMVCVSLSAQLLSTPLVLFYFGRLACYSLLANIVVVPLTTLVVYGGVLALALMPVPVLQGWVMAGVVALAQGLNAVVVALSHLPGGTVDGLRLRPAQVVLLYVLIGCCSGLCHYGALLYRSANGRKL